ncbi:MAG: hypothetical protein U5K00_18850 [Melioribacteraceae bacterium]|nr:hypothetical protein [Melioribacteraceae bacterium]
MKYQTKDFFIVGGENYGQGSSREHAAIAPRYLGLKVVIAKSFARIHWQNLANFGIVPLTFEVKSDWEKIEQEDKLELTDLRGKIKNESEFKVKNLTKDFEFTVTHNLSERQIESILEGSLINVVKKK